MSAFFVGQRVRIVWSAGWPELAGCEGRIVGFATLTVGLNIGESAYSVAPDRWGSPIAPTIGMNGGIAFAALSDQLEPILPEGAAPGEFTTLADLLASLNVEVPA